MALISYFRADLSEWTFVTVRQCSGSLDHVRGAVGAAVPDLATGGFPGLFATASVVSELEPAVELVQVCCER